MKIINQEGIKLDKSESVMIEQCRNGFIVKGRLGPDTEGYVFQSMTELLAFVNEHFEYRNSRKIMSD